MTGTLAAHIIAQTNDTENKPLLNPKITFKPTDIVPRYVDHIRHFQLLNLSLIHQQTSPYTTATSQLCLPPLGTRPDLKLTRTLPKHLGPIPRPIQY